MFSPREVDFSGRFPNQPKRRRAVYERFQGSWQVISETTGHIFSRISLRSARKMIWRRSGSAAGHAGVSFTPGLLPMRVSPTQWAIVERAERAGCTLRQAAMVSQVSERWLWEQRPQLRGVAARAKQSPALSR